MHYDLRKCGGMQLACKQTPPKYGWSNLYDCTVDKIIEEQISCIYAPMEGNQQKCFLRPAKLHESQGFLTYSDNNFGQRECLSMLDQALILSRYSVATIKKDAYGIDSLVSRGICEAVDH
jgi:hypothetical protein